MFKHYGVALIVTLFSVAGTAPALAMNENKPPPVGSYIYWDDGISLTGPASHVDLHVGGKMNYDLGNINADVELQAAFPDFDGLISSRLSFSIIFLRLVVCFDFATFALKRAINS